MMAVIELNKDTFKEEILDSDKVVLVDFWAEWCMPCKMMAPAYEELSKKLAMLKFCKFNVDSASEIAEEYGIRGIPCIVVFKSGREIGRIVGNINKNELENKIKGIIGEK
ncbi:thioredoxin [Candidatus Woesearchaeota archaeon]|nr:thioredoxin [Candidatus Woesearchaeota archaeon]